jgi:hypothetical protein
MLAVWRLEEALARPVHLGRTGRRILGADRPRQHIAQTLPEWWCRADSAPGAWVTTTAVSCLPGRFGRSGLTVVPASPPAALAVASAKCAGRRQDRSGNEDLPD